MSNPLLNAAAAKRAKKEALGVVNNDDGHGGLLIVHPRDIGPTLSQPAPSNTTESIPTRYSSQPLQAGPSKHPAKKFRADSETITRPPSKSKSSKATHDRNEDAEVEMDVRAMEDETDMLRRQSRVHSTIDSSLLVINNDRSQAYEANGRPTGHRRKSSVNGRGKRTSSSYQATGIITQPHNSVSESSFHKHIDCDLPEPERLRQLLIWCSLRAASNPSSTTSSSSSSSSKPPPPTLPPLSTQGAQVLKSVQEGLVRMLAGKEINLSLYEPEAASSSTRPPEDLRENEQNVRNRQWEVRYTQHIQQAQAEEESWKKVSYGYDTYTKGLQSSLEKRAAAVQLDPGALSAKAKGKRRATGDLSEMESYFIPQEHEISPEFRPALALAKSVLGHRAVGDERPIGGGAVAGRRGSMNMSRSDIEAELKRRLPELEYKVDQIFAFVSAARMTTNIAEKALNERFDLLSAKLASRTVLHTEGGEVAAAPRTAAGLLATYVAPAGTMKGPADQLDLLRALSRVDRERPAAMVGDAARRAAKEVQRAAESGAVAVGDRRLTSVPATPRKTPGTPRRGNTPSRDR
ncbi:Kinetochore protein mis13 [Psilocybe cubensis]|uniref:Kinetochore protein mis13 n=1 Tax=Psilocybe cubensis TaxID=181762 RepID=A0ACB8H8A3_PSICU|nr:Kinetochore protein mis13 [Psilocybe cubensis]KAH9484233.1 Kinetochore protein mis13 [Psilocybe cubensis]